MKPIVHGVENKHCFFCSFKKSFMFINTKNIKYVLKNAAELPANY